MVGRTLGHYRILARLGAGGMGEVYRAEDTTLKRQVALKILPPETAGDSDRLDRFKREARAAATLNHPHIVTMYSVEEIEGTHFLTMELVRGLTLDRWLADEGVPAISGIDTRALVRRIRDGGAQTAVLCSDPARLDEGELLARAAADRALIAQPHRDVPGQIGRASCRERV